MIDVININHGFREISLEFNTETKKYKIKDGKEYSHIVDYAKVNHMEEFANLKKIENIFDLIQMVGLILSFRDKLEKARKDEYCSVVLVDFNINNKYKLTTTEYNMWFDISYNKTKDALSISYELDKDIFKDLKVTKLKDKKYQITFIFNKEVEVMGVEND